MNSTNLNFEYQYSEQAMAPEQAGKVARLYKEVFATPPWNEAFRCTEKGCGKNFGRDLEGIGICPNCGGGLEDYYDLNEVISEIAETSRLIGFKIASVLRGDDLKGFWFGWDGTLDQINEQKLKLSAKDLGTIKDLSPAADKYFYLSEFGVSPACRSQNVGKKLFQFGMERIVTPTIMRTNTNSPAFFIARKNGFSSVWSYNDQSYRVLLTKNI